MHFAHHINLKADIFPPHKALSSLESKRLLPSVMCPSGSADLGRQEYCRLHESAKGRILTCMQARHDVHGEGGAQPVQEQGIVSKWRQKERLKTTAVALVLCLNIGVDPPDVIKISPCARLECWVDPLSMQPPKALETIGGHSTSSMASLCQLRVSVIDGHRR